MAVELEFKPTTTQKSFPFIMPAGSHARVEIKGTGAIRQATMPPP